MERRMYQRIKTNIEGVAYTKNEEFHLLVNNASESGMELIIDKSIVNLRKYDVITFQFIDNILEAEELIIGKAQIVRVKKDKEIDRFYIGCKIIDDFDNAFFDYISRIKTAKYIEYLNSTKVYKKGV